jgi:hypothetical protein
MKLHKMKIKPYGVYMCSIARSEGRPKYTRSIVTLGQRLVEQGKSDPNGYRGSWYYTQYMVGFP